MAPPVNDTFASPTVLGAAPDSILGTTRDATLDASEPVQFANEQSVWYTFTPTVTDVYKFTIKPTSLVYNGTGLSFEGGIGMMLTAETTLAGCTVANALGIAWVSFSTQHDAVVAAKLTSGVTYRIRLYSAAGTAGAQNKKTVDYELEWEGVTQTTNDDFASPQVVTVGVIADQSTKDATWEVGEPLTAASPTWDREQSRWYEFTPATTGKYEIRLLNALYAGEPSYPNQAVNIGYGYYMIGDQTVLANFTWANRLGGTVLTSWENDPDGPGAVIYVDLTAAAVYRIKVASPYNRSSLGYQQDFNGRVLDFDLSIRLVTPPANDNYASATVLSTTLPASLADQSTRDATQEGTEPTWSGETNQSIWYSFTPAVTGLYNFRIKLDSVEYDGWYHPTDIELAMALSDAALASFPAFAEDTVFDPVYWVNKSHGSILKVLNAGTTYRLKVSTNDNDFNQWVAKFDLEWDLIEEPTNDDFANATAISGASGTADCVLPGSTFEATEPVSNYWNAPQDQGTVWFSWTCPADGWYKFNVASIAERQAYYDLAIYTGSALNALTPISKGYLGGEPVAANPVRPTTEQGFQGVAGTVYKIQIACWSEADAIDGTRLSWETMPTPVGDTTATAPNGLVNGEVDNFGYTDNELPPNYVTLLSAHDGWWFDDGRAGRSRWFKVVAASDREITIKGTTWLGNITGWQDSIGLIAYKGANYASLVVAEHNATNEDVAMMLNNGVLETVAGVTEVTIDVLAGETLWVCLFGMYDEDYGGTDIEAQQSSIDLEISSSIPPNDDFDDTARYTYPFNFSRSEYGEYWVYPEGGAREGTTIGATAEVGESAHGGYGPTRSVWYFVYIDKIGDNRFWVEAAQDCVLSIYDLDFAGEIVASVGEDDDSGTGNWPDITINNMPIGDYAICVDSKVETNFVLKWQRQSDGTPPANDDWANAEVITPSSAPIVGSTFFATVEPYERESETLGWGPKDTVWYKYTPTRAHTLKITATVPTNVNNDAYVQVDTWVGDTLETLERASYQEGDGWFSYYDTVAQREAKALYLHVVPGEDYYIRVQTESGGSEDFSLFVDDYGVYVDIQPSGVEEFHGTIIDDAEIYINIQVSSVEVFRAALTTDAGEVYVNLTAGGTETPAKEYLDVGTVYVLFTIDSHDCHTIFDSAQLVAHAYRRLDAQAYSRWTGTTAYRRFEAVFGDGFEEC